MTFIIMMVLTVVMILSLSLGAGISIRRYQNKGEIRSAVEWLTLGLLATSLMALAIFVIRAWALSKTMVTPGAIVQMAGVMALVGMMMVFLVYVTSMGFRHVDSSEIHSLLAGIGLNILSVSFNSGLITFITITIFAALAVYIGWKVKVPPVMAKRTA